MFSKLDQMFIGWAGHGLGWLQERYGFSPPQVLKETLSGGVIAFGALLAALLVAGPMLMFACLALSVPFSLPSVLRLLRRYARDAQKEWDSDLGRTYMALAIGRQESMRLVRMMYVALTFYLVLNSVGAVSVRGIATIDVLFLAMSVLTLLYEYFSAAEPKSPGDRRRFSQPALDFGNSR